MNRKLAVTTSAAIVMLLALATCAVFMGADTKGISINATIMILGCTFGWLLGTLITPYDTKERADFSAYAKAASAFISGYVIAKIDKVIEHILSPTFLFEDAAGFRMMLFVASFCLCLLLTFIFRRYA
jgi:D-alanyl-lipoteichoic acid acyltransferase DltB (MBOAT superfamily)